jgi:predicted 3-demethylubiquinone-9 3-methyltransferase (glyoxalase superfamily)
MQKITPFLWFNGNAEEAVKFYVSVFRNSKVLSTMPGPDGTLMGRASSWRDRSSRR